jgi:hypothetical protein
MCAHANLFAGAKGIVHTSAHVERSNLIRSRLRIVYTRSFRNLVVFRLALGYQIRGKGTSTERKKESHSRSHSERQKNVD